MARGRLFSNIAWMLIWQGTNFLVPLLTFPYLTRVLGVRAYGEFGLSFAVATYFVMVTDYGFNLTGPALIALSRDDHEKISRHFWSIMAAKGALFLICMGTLAVAIMASDAVRAMAPVLIASAGLALANVVTVNWCLQGFERMRGSAVGAMVGRLLAVPATFLFVHHPGDAWIAATLQSISAMIGGVVSLVLLLRMGVIRRVRITPANVVGEFRDAWPIFVSTVAINIYNSTNTIILGVFQGPGAVGIYAAADRLRAAAQGIISPISQAVFPYSNRLIDRSPVEGRRFILKLLVIQGSVTAVISLMLFTLAPLIIDVLVGKNFASSIVVLQILSLTPWLVGISNVLGVQLMLSLGLKKTFSKILLCAAGFDLVIAWPLISRFGAIGTALTVVAAEVVVVALQIAVLIYDKDVRKFLFDPSQA